MAFVTVLVATPLYSFALVHNETGQINGYNEELNEKKEQDVFIVEEDQSKRGQFEKHYLCSDGTYISVTYPEAIHYLDTNNMWQDVDQSLSYNATTGMYTSGKTDFNVSFSHKVSSTNMAQIKRNGYTLSWGILTTTKSKNELSKSTTSQTKRSLDSDMDLILIPSSAVTAKIEDSEDSFDYKNADNKKRLLSSQDTFTLPKISSQISYTDIFDSTQSISLKYTVYHNKIEEDIIIFKKSDLQSVSMNMDVGTLTPVVNTNGSVDLVDTNNEMQFRIGVPYMVDANHNVCNDIQVTAVKNGTSCIITYIPNTEWFESSDRVFPILLDPSITTNDYISNIKDTYVEENSTTNHESEQHLYITPNGNNKRNAIVRMTKLPKIDSAMPIISATLSLTMSSSSSEYVELKAAYLDTGLELNEYDYWLTSLGPFSYTSYTTVDYDDTTVTFDFSPHIYEMYTDERYDNENGDEYYGDFVIGYDYAADTTDIPPFYSSEYTTPSVRPVFTVKYGYTLPAGMMNGSVYSFMNVGSGFYMSVNGSSPANNSNIYQVMNESGVATTSQKFRLEYVPSTGGYLLRSMSSSSGSDKVVSINRVNGELTTNMNVRLSSATDSMAQEWLIVPVDYSIFRIVPRGNMSLTLTAYGYNDGTNTGTSATSQGNIFIKTRTQDDDYQEWYIFDNSDNEVNTSQYRATVETGNYFLGNSYSGHYLHRGSGTTVNGMSGRLSSLGENTVKWKIVNLGDGYCTIQRSDAPRFYLAPTNTTSGSNVKISVNASETIPENVKWSIRLASGGGCIIQHKSSGLYLTDVGGTANPTTVRIEALATPGTDAYSKQAWSVSNEDYYVELGFGASFKDIAIGISESKSAIVNRHPSSASWASYTDFDYTITTGGNYVTYNASTHRFTGRSIGTASVTAVHKTTGLTNSFNIKITKKAIIILPGIMGSQIFANGSITIPSDSITDAPNTFADGTRLWDPSISATQLILVDEKIRALEYTSVGTAKYSTTINPPTINQYNLGGDFQYGATDIYRHLYNTMYENFYGEYDIVFYEYDWRKDPYDSACELSDFINNHYYGDIVFVSHSMGGLVSSYYLSLGDAQRDLVNKHITIGTPFLGSVEMPYMYVTGNIRDAFYENWIVSESVTKIAYNLPSIYALFPFEQNWQSYMSYRSSPETTTSCATFSSTMNVLSTYMPNWNSSMANNVFANRDNLFLANGKHITTLVDSYYIVGIGKETTYSTTGLLDNLIAPTQFNGFTLTKNTSGDGTVSKYSATIGNTTPSSKTYYKTSSSTKTATHVGMVSGEDSNLNQVDLSTLDFVSLLIDGSINSYTATQLSTLFGISQ